MKKRSKVLLSLLGISLLLAGCGAKKEATKESSAPKEDKVIKVATALDSSEKILDIANKEAEKEGYKIEVVRVNDNVQYNKLLNDKEVDANFSQHGPYMEEFNKANNGNLVIAQKVYDARVGFYSKDYKKIEDIPDN
ncbi:MAG: MetQ/NlpA family ABC transporter substrate-binding protein, partial [Vagococcus sp.]